MERRSHNLIFTGLILAVTGAAAVGAVLVLSGAPGSDGADIPAAAVEGLADLDDASLGPASDVEAPDPAERPVLQVADPTGGSGASADVPTGASATPGSGSTAVVTDPPSSTTSTVPATDPTSTAPVTSAPATSATPTSSSTTSTGGGSVPAGYEWLSAAEWEIVRLTNELRTDPNGALKRQGAVIDCGGRIPIDAATGQYQAVAALTVDEVASVQVARPWAAQLTTDLLHRPQAGIEALQAAGVAVVTAGENIAYHNYPDKALQHFAGWRESDGHFCNMMDPGFTHIGVGEFTRSDGFSFATQNFFSLQPEG